MISRSEYSGTLVSLCCVSIVVHVCSAKGGINLCAERQILNTLDLPELFRSELFRNECVIETKALNLSTLDCTVWDFGQEDEYDDLDQDGKGYTDCADLQFSSTATSNVIGTEIRPYEEKFPNFNISFTDIKWDYMQYRLEVGVSKLCHKLWFNSSQARSHVMRVSFACHQFGDWAAASRYQAALLVDVGRDPSHITSRSHYVMSVPTSRREVDSSNKAISINDWLILVAVDVSHKPDLFVYWPAVPDRYNVSEYIVQLNNDKPEKVSCRDEYCSLKIFAGYSSRNVTVSVQPVHEDCHRPCRSKSPVIMLETYLPLYITIPAVLAPILIVLFIVFFIYYFCCTAPQEPLKVLLLFDSTTKHHYRVVCKLADYLKEFCGVHCLLDTVEIPLTESQNPSKWLHKTIEEVDAVLYVASPEPHMDIRFSDYPTLVYEALVLIQQRRRSKLHYRPGHYMVAVPSYCTKENVPEFLGDVPHYLIPKELGWLLWSVYNQQCWVAPFTWMARAYLRCGWCPGPVSAFKQQGTDLKKALEIANAQTAYDDDEPLSEPGDDIWDVPSTIFRFPGSIDDILRGSVVSKDDISVKKNSIAIDTLPLSGVLD